MRSARLPFLLFLLCTSALRLRAATFIVPSDAALISSAEVVVRGTVTEREVYRHVDGKIYTRYALTLDRVYRGEGHVGESLRFDEYGGVLDDRFMFIAGIPQYRVGENVLVLLDRDGEGRLRTHEMMLGRFSLVNTARGTLYVRGDDMEREVFGFDATLHPYHEPLRDAARFEHYVEEIVAGRDAQPDYVISIMEEPFLRQIVPNATPTDYLLQSSGMGFRWRFDNGDAPSYRTNGAQPAVDSLSAVDRAMGAWNGDPGSTVNLSRGTTTSATFDQTDGRSTIELNMSSGFPQCGASAVGCGGPAGGGTHTFSGATFITITEGDVWIKSGFTTNQQLFDEVLTHEIGHTLGFRHSNQGTPSSNNAVMQSTVSGSHGAHLASYDQDAVRAVYGNGTQTCDGPQITTQPQNRNIVSGSSTNLTVSATGTAPLSYQWYRGTSGDTSNAIAGATSSSVSVSPTSTSSYWVRITNSCTTNNSVDSSTVTVTVDPCTPVSITQQPQSQNVAQFDTVQLLVQANGTAPLSYQWFRGTSGDTSQPLTGATNSFVTINTASAGTFSFWVRVSNSCNGSSVNSAAATVKVTACTPVTIATEPQDQSLIAGQSATLTVIPGGSGPFTFEWFQGDLGNTGVRVATQQAFQTSPLNATTKFWARVRNCSGNNSADTRSVTITVAASCTAPQISALSPAVTIASGSTANLSVTASGTSLRYQWFRGPVGDTSNPITGATTAAITTPALPATTSFWVRVSNDCGSVDSSAVVVTVTCDVTITTQPLNATIQSGATAQLTVVATSATPLTYQWFIGAPGDTNRPVTGATAASLTTATLTESTTFWVRVTAPCGSVDSAAAKITVIGRKRPVKR